MVESNRQKKIAGVLQNDLALVLQKMLRDSGQLGIIISVSKVTVTTDLSLSKVYVSVFPSDKADYKVLFYTPTIEVELCGHATIATFYTMATKSLLNKKRITQETKAGIFPVEIEYSSQDSVDKVRTKSLIEDDVSDGSTDTYTLYVPGEML